MLKDNILELVYNFEKETWKYNESEKLYNDMEYIYSIENELKNCDDTSAKEVYNKLLVLMGMIRFKYGFESVIINDNPELSDLKRVVDDISLKDEGINDKYNYVSNIYNNYTSQIKNVDFIKNRYEGAWGKEGTYLALESLKSLISNDSYRELINDEQIRNILKDCVMLNNDEYIIKSLEAKYQEIIKQIWLKSLTNKVEDNGNFRMLFSNISGGDLRDKAEMLINRPDQSSCSMISSNFIATYGDDTRKIGFIYPNNSEIVMTSAYDLGSNVFGAGSVNQEKGTILATPEVIEKIGKTRAIQQGQDLYSSSCYNEILVNAKPCGIVVLGLGENDLNIDYQDAKMLSLEMNLPIYYVDTMQYKDKLSEADKNYIAFHSIMSYLGISREEITKKYQDNSYGDITKLINDNKEQLSDVFLKLKSEGRFSKENMMNEMSNIVDISKWNSNVK